MPLYAVNRLCVDHTCTKKVILSRVSTPDEGRKLGLEIENRGGLEARWSFVGQIEHIANDLEVVTGSAGRDDRDLLRFHQVDVTKLIF